MAKIFSWKLPNGKYSYLVKPYVRDRVTDSSVLAGIANTVNAWTEKEYKTAFEQMKKEVQIAANISFDEDYQKYYNVLGNSSGKIVLISGLDGKGGGSNSSPISQYVGLSKDEMEALQNKVSEMVNEKTNTIVNQTKKTITSNIDKLKQDISDTRDNMTQIQTDLNNQANDTSVAMDNLRKELDNIQLHGGIDPDIVATFPQLKDWYTKNSGLTKVDFDSSYNYLSGTVTTLNKAESTQDARITELAASINTVSGNVISVSQTLDGLNGIYATKADYTTLSGNVNNLESKMDAVDGTITDKINSITGDIVTQVETKLDSDGSIEAKVDKMISDSNSSLGKTIASMNARIDAAGGGLSGSTETNSAMTQVINWYNLSAATIDQNVTNVNTLDGTVNSINSQWNANKGFIQTVGDFITNDEGELKTKVSSMIQQSSDSILTAVKSGDTAASILLALQNDSGGTSSIASIIADDILLSGDTFVTNLYANNAAFDNVIGKSLTVNSAKIEDIVANSAKINDLVTDSITANSATIENIIATSTTIDKIVSTAITANSAAIENIISTSSTIDNIISDKISAKEISTDKLITTPVNENAHIEITGSTMNIFGTKGVANIRVAVDNNGVAVLQFYDNNGNLLYDLGPNGIGIFTSSLSASTFIREIVKTSETFNLISNGIVLNELADSSITESGLEDTNFYDLLLENTGMCYTLESAISHSYGSSSSPIKRIYQYFAAKDNGKVVDGQYNRKENAINYDKKYITQANITLDNSYLFNGIISLKENSFSYRGANSWDNLNGLIEEEAGGWDNQSQKEGIYIPCDYVDFYTKVSDNTDNPYIINKDFKSYFEDITISGTLRRIVCNVYANGESVGETTLYWKTDSES